MAITVQRTEYGFSERLLDNLAFAAAKLDLSVVRLERDSIIEGAMRHTGLTDLGDDRVVEGLDRVIDNVKFGYSHFGRALMRKLMLEAVTNRLLVTDYVKRHPDVLDVKVEKPIFVLGFPRTGTTLLQNLLPLHESRRPLQFWELYKPIPVIEGDPERDRATRKARIGRILSIANFFNPEMKAIHEVRPDTPEECWPLFTNCLRVFNYDLAFGLTEYGDWLLETDMDWAYQEYRTMLQILLHQWPAKQLVLKCPEHLWFLDSLLKAFPDACVVQTHRDPLACIASYCSMVSLNHRNFFGSFDPVTIGQQITKRFHLGVQRAYEVRQAHPNPDQFYDVRFHELVRDQAAGVQAITEHFGLPNVAEGEVDRWLSSAREDKRGAHKYSAELFGLEKGPVYERYSRYIDWAGVHVAA